METKKALVVFVILLGAFLGWRLYVASPKQESIVPSNPLTTAVPMKIGKGNLMVEMRRTDTERALGLSYRERLAADSGMVFVFPEVQMVTFWMKDMHFPLDMVWIRERKVVDITENVPAPTEENPQPQTVNPKEAVDMVVEVNAGWVANNGVKVGDSITLEE